MTELVTALIGIGLVFTFLATLCTTMVVVAINGVRRAIDNLARVYFAQANRKELG